MMTPSSDLLMIASSEDSTMAARRALSLLLTRPFARGSTSRKTRTAPVGTAASPARIGRATLVSSISRSAPSRARSTPYGLASPTTTPVPEPPVAPGSRPPRAGVRSLTMWNTSPGRGRPVASACGHPVRDWAALRSGT